MNTKKLVFLWRNLTKNFMGVFPKTYNYDFHKKPNNEVDADFCRWVVAGDDRAIRDFLSRKTPNQKTLNRALELSSFQGLFSTVKLLFSSFDANFDFGDALTLAAKNGHFDVVKFLAPHSNLKSSTCSALRGAVANNKNDIARFLLPLSGKEDRIAALYEASNWGNFECIQMILPLVRQQNRAIAFFGAAMSGRADVLQFFLDQGYRQRSRHKNYAHNVFLQCAAYGRLPELKIVLPYVESKNKNSEALALAAVNKKKDVFDFLYPISDPLDALKEIKKISSAPDHLLDGRMRIDEERDLLLDAAKNVREGAESETAQKPRRKM